MEDWPCWTVDQHHGEGIVQIEGSFTNSEPGCVFVCKSVSYHNRQTQLIPGFNFMNSTLSLPSCHSTGLTLRSSTITNIIYGHLLWMLTAYILVPSIVAGRFFHCTETFCRFLVHSLFGRRRSADCIFTWAPGHRKVLLNGCCVNRLLSVAWSSKNLKVSKCQHFICVRT